MDIALGVGALLKLKRWNVNHRLGELLFFTGVGKKDHRRRERMQEILIYETRPSNNSTAGFQIKTVTPREVGFTADLEKS